MATTPQSHSAESGRSRRLYDFAEGYGSIYGRYVRKRLSQRLIAENGIRTVLEAPCNAEAYFASPGTQSVVFAENGCSVVLAHPSEEIVQKTRDFWAGLGLPDTPVIHVPDVYHLPFADGQFDLVWNFDSVPLIEDPSRFIAEMARVSGSLVLIIVANTWNVGYPIHALAGLLSGRPSPWGSRKWMSLAPIEKVLSLLGLTIVERGLVDMPPWPGFDAMNLVGQLLRRSTAASVSDYRSDQEVEHMLDKLTFIEYARLPSILKVPFSHQQYVLARKTI